MRLNAATCTELFADVEIGVDPTGSTVEVMVDDDWHPAEWVGEVAQKQVTRNGVTRTIWVQTARTTQTFAGPDAEPTDEDCVDLERGRHLTKTRVTKGHDRLVADSDPIDVR
jgi:hypothetical protein